MRNVADRQGFVLSVYVFVFNRLADIKTRMLPRMLPKKEARPEGVNKSGQGELPVFRPKLLL